MHRTLQYAILFVALILVQTFLLNGLNLSLYVYPIIYIGFILLLPMEIHPAGLLMLGVLTGMTADFAMGTGGLNSIATIFTSFIRPYILTLTVGKADIRDGGVPAPATLGPFKFLRYAGMATFIHCLVYFTFEDLSWEYYHLTLLRTAASSAVSLILIYVVSLLMQNRR